VESASVATALAKYDLPVPGGPYNKNALQGRLLPEIDHANHIKHLKQIAFNKLTTLKTISSGHLPSNVHGLG
jgi:hypothetical protein